MTVSTPKFLKDDIEVIRGDDYVTATTPLTWTDTDAIWPTLAGATVTFTRATFSKVVTVTSQSLLTLQLTAAETTSLECIKDSYNITAVLTGGEIQTLVIGKFIVLDKS